MRSVGQSKPLEKDPRKGETARNEYVQLAVELRDMAFQPKKWRRVMDQSTQLLHTSTDSAATRSSHQDLKDFTTTKRKMARVSERHVAVARPKSREEDDGEQTTDQGKLPRISIRSAASSAKLPTLPPTLAQYLNQPQLVAEILRESSDCADDIEQEAGALIPPAIDEEDEDEDDDKDKDKDKDNSTLHQPVSPDACERSRTAVRPVLSILSPRTRDGLAHLPALTADELHAVHELERLAEETRRRQSLYVALKQFGSEKRTLSRGFRHRKMATRELAERQAASVREAKQRAFQSPWKKRHALSGHARELQLQRAEVIQMALEDVNALFLQVSPRSRFSRHPETAPFVLPSGLSTVVRSKWKHEHKRLLEMRQATTMQERTAEEQLDRTLEEIKQWIPLEVMYEFGQGKFASPAQQRAVGLLYRVGQRLKNNLLVQAIHQWKLVVANENLIAAQQSALTLQCWWRQLRAVQTVASRRRVRREIERRQRSMLLLLASAENKSACTITAVIRKRGAQRRREKAKQRDVAARRIQTFWCRQQAAWMALRHHMRQQKRRNAALIVQRYFRGFLARRLRRLLAKIKQVQRTMVQREHEKNLRAKQRHRFGAVLVIQRAFRAWVQCRLIALRRRRAQFEREKGKILKLQAQYRGRRARRWVVQHRKAFSHATLVIQCAWRSYVARRTKRGFERCRQGERAAQAAESVERRRRMKAKALVLPVNINKAAWNGLFPMATKAAPIDGKKDVDGTPKEIVAATTIQALWRGKKLRRRLKHVRARHRELARRSVNRKRREAAVCIQRHARGIQGRSRAWSVMVHRAASKIQGAWRGISTRRELFRMRAALKALMKMQCRWRIRRNQEIQGQRHRSAIRIQRGWRRCMGKAWLYRAVRRQQFLAEENAMGVALIKLTQKRIDDDLLIQSFIHHNIQISKNPHEVTILGEDEEDIRSVQRSLYKLDSAKRQWKRRGYDGVWQELYREISGNSFEIDSSHFARFLKALPRGFINQRNFSLQIVDLIFAKMKEPKSRTITFTRFNKAMAMVWQEKFAPAGALETSGADATVQKKRDQDLYLRFMHDFVLPSTLHHGKYRKLLELSCTQRLEWAANVLRRFANRIAGAERHHQFVLIYRQHKLEQLRSHAARVLQRHYRLYKFRATLKATLAQMFIEYIDYKGRSVRFEHIETRRAISAVNRRPAFLRGVCCNSMIPLPFPGEEFRAVCERHESATDPQKKVHATVYCVECEDPMCVTCFARDHDKRAAFQSHAQRKIEVCSHCHVETATRECLQCGDGKVPFCDVCFPFVHKKTAQLEVANDEEADVSAKAMHRYRRLVVACVECEEKVAQWMCDVCEDIFCKRCLSKLHAKGKRQSHHCHRLSYFSVLKQKAQIKRQTEAQKHHDQRRRERDARQVEEERVRKLHEASATTIQAWVRSFQARQRGKAYMKLVRRTNAAKAQRVKDDTKRSSWAYRLKSVVGLEPTLKSDTLDEIDARRRRIASIKKTLFFYRNEDDEDDGDAKTSDGKSGKADRKKKKRKKRWTKKARAAVENAATTWLAYGTQVKIMRGTEWKDSVATILSTQNLFNTGHVLVFIQLANRAVVVNWEDILPYNEDEILREPYESPFQVATDAVFNFRAKYARVVDAAARRAKLLYVQSTEFHDVVQYAWVVEFNKFEQKEEYWNVVLNKRTFTVPKAMMLLERMEGEERDRVDARVAMAKKKLQQLLNPLQSLDKTRLAARRHAVVPIAASLKQVENDVHSRLRVEAEALRCAQFWHDSVVPNQHFGGKYAQRFLTACSVAPRSTEDCWLMVRLLQWIELQDSDAYVANSKEFFKKAADIQMFIVGELTESLSKNDMKESQENFERLLKLKDETVHLLISKAEQEAVAAEAKER